MRWLWYSVIGVIGNLYANEVPILGDKIYYDKREVKESKIGYVQW